VAPAASTASSPPRIAPSAVPATAIQIVCSACVAVSIGSDNVGGIALASKAIPDCAPSTRLPGLGPTNVSAATPRIANDRGKIHATRRRALVPAFLAGTGTSSVVMPSSCRRHAVVWAGAEA
jgi:hypothetical protein